MGKGLELEQITFEIGHSKFASGGQRDCIPLESPIVACKFYVYLKMKLLYLDKRTRADQL